MATHPIKKSYPLGALVPELRRLAPAIRALDAADSDALLNALALGFTRQYGTRISPTFIRRTLEQELTA